MKIAIFSDCYLDLTGGIVSTINTEKTALEERGHLVTIFSSAYPHTQTDIKKLANQQIFPVPSCRIFGRGLTPIARRPKIVENWLLKHHPELQEYDVFYIHYEAGCSIAGLRLARRLHIPSIQVMHGREDIGEEKLIPFGFRTFVATMLNWFHSWYLPHPVKIHRDKYLATTIARAKMWTLMVNHANFADLVITPSEHFRQKLLHYGVTKSIVALHHGLHEDLLTTAFTPKTLAPGETLNLIWHSRVSGEKRIMPFLTALNSLHQTFPNYRLAVYGSGSDLNRAKKYVRRHYLNVKFYGNTKFRQIWQQIQKSHLDVLVSYDYDTFGMTLIEAAAAGTPVFFCDPNMQEIVPLGSFIMSKDETPTSMAIALQNLLEHPDQIHAMSEIMLKHRDEFAISRKIQKLEQIFSDIIEP